MAEYRDRFGELRSIGVALVAVSVDAPGPSRALADALGLPFPLLSDTEREVVCAYGVYNANEKGGIAYPSTFVLDEARVVCFRSLDRTASRVDLDAVFAFLRSSGGDSRATPPRRAVVPRLRVWVQVGKNSLRFGVRSARR